MGDHDHLAIQGAVGSSRDEAAESAWDCSPGSGEGSRTLTERGIVGAVRGSAYCVICSAFLRVFKIRRIVRDGIAVL
jgi:hypothetical protein